MEPLYRLAAAVAAETDPRAPNARGFALDGAGRVVGMELRWQSRPETDWELVQVVLIDETQAAGNHVATFSVLDGAGLEVGNAVDCYLFWEDPRNGLQLGRPGNPNRQHEITSAFPGDGRIGPLGLGIGYANGKWNSDTVTGLGLWNGHHVCFLVTWRKRGATPPPGGGEPQPDGTQLTRVETKLDALSRHLGL